MLLRSILLQRKRLHSKLNFELGMSVFKLVIDAVYELTGDRRVDNPRNRVIICPPCGLA